MRKYRMEIHQQLFSIFNPPLLYNYLRNILMVPQNLFKLAKDEFVKIAKMSNLQKHTFHQEKTATQTPWLTRIRFTQISLTRL